MDQKYSIMNDEELFHLMADKGRTGEQAFAELYSRFSTPVYRYCKRLLDNDEQADDVFQDVFVRFYNSASKDKKMTNVFSYLYTIARNQCLTLKTRRKLTVPIEGLEIGARDKTVENDELSGIVTAALDILPDNFREALVMQIYNDMSYQEIAEIMDVPVSTVRNWIVRGKKKIRDVMGTYLEDYRND